MLDINTNCRNKFNYSVSIYLRKVGYDSVVHVAKISYEIEPISLPMTPLQSRTRR